MTAWARLLLLDAVAMGSADFPAIPGRRLNMTVAFRVTLRKRHDILNGLIP